MCQMALEMAVARCDVSLSREVARRMMRPRGKRRGAVATGDTSDSSEPWYYRPILRGIQLAASRNFPKIVEALEAEMEKVKE